MSHSDDSRLDDYLNDQFQTAADFTNIDDLLANVALQKKQLDEQLQDARAKLAASRKTAEKNECLILEQAKEFERQQVEVQKRLMVVTSSDSVEEATRRLKGPLEKLRRVELAKQYVELLQEVDELVSNARHHLPQSPKDALRPYTQLKELAIALRQKQDLAEGAGVHLVNHVETTTERLWVEMKKIMTDEFESVLTKSKWPREVIEPNQEWTQCFEKLLDLQDPEMTKDGIILLPIAVLTKPFTLNFRYQFMSDKPTSDLRHLGDYFLDWFLGEISKLQDYLRDYVSPILAAHFHRSELSENLLYIDAVSAFINALLPILQQKVADVIAAIPPSNPAWLSKFIDQLLTFDEKLRRDFNYDGGDIERGWKGVTSDVLETSFDRWLGVEKDFALARYYEIVKAPNSGHIDYDSAAYGKTKSTYGANQVTDLLMNVYGSYNRLRRFSQKTRFLIEIQAEILDQYQGRLTESLDVYRTITSSVARRVHGISREEKVKLEGVGGLDSLCRVFGSANHIIESLKDWSCVDFFVDLWQELQERAKKTSEDGNLAGPISYAVIKESTSVDVGTDSDGGSVFDVTIAGFDGLCIKSTELLIQAMTYSFPSMFSQYIRAQWTTIGEVDDPVTISSELDQPLKMLKEELMFLTRAMAFVSFRRVWRPVYNSLQDLLWNEVLMKQQFTALGAARFALDVQAIQDVVDSSCVTYHGKGADLTTPKLREGVALLNLPLDQSKPLFEAGADELLVNLGLSRLTKLEARSILQSRMEFSE